MYSNVKRADGGLKDGLKEITISEAGSASWGTICISGDRVDGIPFTKEHGNSYRLITNKKGKPVGLGPDARWALNGYEQALIATMRSSHEPKGAGKGSATKSREGSCEEGEHTVAQGQYRCGA